MTTATRRTTCRDCGRQSKSGLCYRCGRRRGRPVLSCGMLRHTRDLFGPPAAQPDRETRIALYRRRAEGCLPLFAPPPAPGEEGVPP